MIDIPKEFEHFRHYLVHDDVIDGLHLELLQRIQDVKRQITSEKLLSALLDIVDEWTKHVVHETNFMRHINYPYIQSHISEHCEITAKFAEAVSSIRKSGLTSYGPYNPVTGMSEVLLYHFDHADMQLLPYIKGLDSQ